MGINVCEGMMILWKRSCMKELPNQWKAFCQMNAMNRQKLKATLLKLSGRMGIQVLPTLLNITMRMEKCTSVEAMLVELTPTTYRKLRKRKNFLQLPYHSLRKSFHRLKLQNVSAKGTRLAVVASRMHLLREQGSIIFVAYNNAPTQMSTSQG